MKQSGNLDVEIEYYKPTETANRTGQIRIDYVLHDLDWAERVDLLTIKDSERVQNSSHKVSFGIAQFRVRFREDINAMMRIKADGVFFEIVGQPLVQGRRHWLLLNCEQRDDKV